MKSMSRILMLVLCFSIFFISTSCTSNEDKLKTLWLGSQSTIREDFETPLDKFSVYYFYEDNKLDLGDYDYSSDDYNNNYVWVEKDIKYEWVDENTIDIKYKGSNIFKVSIEGSKLTLKSENYTIEFEEGKFTDK